MNASHSRFSGLLTQFQRPGRLLLKLRDDDCCDAPAHLDVIHGLAQPAGTVDRAGRIDQALMHWGGSMQVCCPHHAARSLHSPGQRCAHFDDLERGLGMARTRSITMSAPDQTANVIESLRDLDEVEWVMVETLSFAPLHARAQSTVVSEAMILQPHLQVGAPEALSMVRHDSNLGVAVIDTGVALTHNELIGRLRSGFDTVDLGTGPIGDNLNLVGDSRGRDFDATDMTGHGSHVAGTIGARGEHLPVGVAGAAYIIPVRALAAASSGGRVFGVGGLLDIDAGIKVACDLGAKVMNMSFGTPADSLDPNAPAPHADVIAYAREKGVIPVAAMGNSGETERFYPAALPDVIAVGSVDAENQPSDFSTRGEHTDIAAPGENIISLGLSGYKESTGTSHATPFVAGAVALLAARAREHNNELAIDLARQALRESADNKPANPPDPAIGYGTLNIPAAIRRLDEILTTREI